MIQWVEVLLEKRKNRRRDAEFRRGIAAFNRKILEPKGLHFGADAQLIHQKRNRRVFADEKHVWKFYHHSQRNFARNFAATSELLEGAGIPAPRVLFQASAKKTGDKFGLSLIMMDRIQGTVLGDEEFESDATQRQLGEMLVAMHANKSPHWGSVIACRKTRQQGPFTEFYFSQQLKDDVKLISEWLRASKQPPLDGLDHVFLEERLKSVEPPDGQYSLVCTDAHRENFFALPEGRLAIIDLDLAAYWDYPCDLAFVLTGGKRGLKLEQGEGLFAAVQRMENDKRVFLDAYFQKIPEHRARWESVRELYVMREVLRATATMIKGMQPEYNEFLGRDPEQATAFVQRSVSAIRTWIENPS